MRPSLPEDDPTQPVLQRRALESAWSEHRLRAVLEGALELGALLSADGTVLEANNAMLRPRRLSRDAVVGRRFCDVDWGFLPDAKVRLQRILETDGEPTVRFHAADPRPNGGPHAIECTVSTVRIRPGKTVLRVFSGRSMRASEAAEAAATRTLAKIGESAAILAHEIRSPITALNLALHTVASHLRGDQQAIVADLVSRLERVERVCQQTLVLAKPLEIRPGPCDARRLFHQVYADLGPRCTQAGALLEVRLPAANLTFRADERWMRNVLTNLVSNALEATGGGGRILLSAARAADQEIVLTVDDNGSGVSDSVCATLFRPFVTTKSTGTGLGLAICERVVEAHAGSIGFETSALGGARFWIRLPAGR